MKCKLSDICEYRKGKVNTSNLTLKTYISTENMLPDKAGVVDANSLPSTTLVQEYKENDTLVSNIRPYFKKVWQAKHDGGCSNDVLVFQGKSNVDKDFLYYILTNDDFFAYSMATSKGTKMPRGDKKSIMQYEIQLFDIKIQKRIASILKLLDKKIELNNAINNNLEQQAQAIFKSWFIDFDPFDGIRPSDWIIGTIDNLGSEIICGKTPSTKKKEYYGSDMPFITIPDMHGCVYNVVTEKYLSIAGIASQSKKTLPPNSVCVSCIGTAGLVTLVSEKSQSNQQINAITPKEGISPYYVYLLMKTLSKIINKLGQSGSTIVNLNKKQFSKIQVIIPSRSILCNFDILCNPLFEMILSNQRENIRLVNLRDILLTKLMKGELDVSNINL